MSNVCYPRPRWFVYLPLLGAVIPTLAIGYGWVIPRSCIAGFNLQTIGFAATVIGFAASYVAGVGIARRQGAKRHA